MLALARAVGKLSDDQDRDADPDQPYRRRAEPGTEDKHEEQQHAPPGQPWTARAASTLAARARRYVERADAHAEPHSSSMTLRSFACTDGCRVVIGQLAAKPLVLT